MKYEFKTIGHYLRQEVAADSLVETLAKITRSEDRGWGGVFWVDDKIVYSQDNGPKPILNGVEHKSLWHIESSLYRIYLLAHEGCFELCDIQIKDRIILNCDASLSKVIRYKEEQEKSEAQREAERNGIQTQRKATKEI